ncbi:MAG: hypothetical protein LBD33_00770 [Puniceicoccales bacterium]|nr:hypothetical protein [Puniceicoccales bacterium]
MSSGVVKDVDPGAAAAPVASGVPTGERFVSVDGVNPERSGRFLERAIDGRAADAGVRACLYEALGEVSCRIAEFNGQIEGTCGETRCTILQIAQCNESLGDKYQALEVEFQVLQAEMRDIGWRLGNLPTIDLENLIMGSVEEREMLGKQIAELTDKIKKNETQMEELECERDNLQEENVRWSAELERFGAGLPKLRAEGDELRDQVTSLTAESNELGAEGDELRDQVGVLWSRLHKISENLQVREQHIDDARSQNANRIAILEHGLDLNAAGAELAQVKNAADAAQSRLTGCNVIAGMVDEILSRPDIHLSRIAVMVIIGEAMIEFQNRFGGFDYGNGDVLECAQYTMSGVIKEVQQDGEAKRINDLFTDGEVSDGSERMLGFISEFRSLVGHELQINRNIQLILANLEEVRVEITRSNFGYIIPHLYDLWCGADFSIEDKVSLLLHGFLCSALRVGGDRGSQVAWVVVARLSQCQQIQEIVTAIEEEMGRGEPVIPKSAFESLSLDPIGGGKHKKFWMK